MRASREAGAEALAPVREPRRLRALAAEHRVRGPRRRTAELRGRDRPHPALEPASSKIASRELGPRALARGGDVPDARCGSSTSARVAAARCPTYVGQPTLVVDDRDLVALAPEPQHRPHEVVPGRPEQPRRAHDPRRPRRRRPRRAASSARTPRAGRGPSDSTYGVALRPVEDVVATRSRRAARRARRRCASRRRSPPPRPAGRPPPRRRPSTPPRAARGRAARARRAAAARRPSPRRRARRRRRPRTSSASARPSWPPAPVIRTRRRRAERIGDRVLQRSRRAGRSRGCRARPGRPGRTPGDVVAEQESVSASKPCACAPGPDRDRVVVADVARERLARLAVEDDDAGRPLRQHEEVVLAALVVVQPADHARRGERHVRLPRRLRQHALARGSRRTSRARPRTGGAEQRRRSIPVVRAVRAHEVVDLVVGSIDSPASPQKPSTMSDSRVPGPAYQLFTSVISSSPRPEGFSVGSRPRRRRRSSRRR